MNILFDRVKDLNATIKLLYQELEALPAYKYMEHRAILNKIRYNESKVEEYKLILKYEKNLEYYSV
jgi:hypothetical protein